MRLGYQPHVYVQGFSAISRRADREGDLIDLGVRISQGVSAVVDGKEVEGHFPPSPITRKRLQDSKKRGQVMAQNAAIVRREGIAHIVQQFYQDIGGISLYYGKKFDYQDTFKLLPFLGFQYEYIFENVILTMPWAKDLCPFIDQIQLGNHFGFCFPIVLETRRSLKIALAKSGFDQVLMRSGVRDTVMLFVRNENAVKFTFYFPGIKTYIPRIEGSGNVYGNEQTSQDFSETEEEMPDKFEVDYEPRKKTGDTELFLRRRRDAVRMRRYRDRLKKGENFENVRRKVYKSEKPKIYATNLLTPSTTPKALDYNDGLRQGSILFNCSVGLDIIVKSFPKMSLVGRCVLEEMFASKKNFDITSVDGSCFCLFADRRFYLCLDKYDRVIYEHDFKNFVI